MQARELATSRPARDLGDQGDGSGTISCAEEIAPTTRNGAMALDVSTTKKANLSAYNRNRCQAWWAVTCCKVAMWQRQLGRWKWMSSWVGCDMLQLAMWQKQPAMVQVVATQRRCCIADHQDDAARAAITMRGKEGRHV